jgi:hypothetical protein
VSDCISAERHEGIATVYKIKIEMGLQECQKGSAAYELEQHVLVPCRAQRVALG